MQAFDIRPLEASTWADFASLVGRHGGVWGGCWCLEFHAEGARHGPQRQAQKECLVREGRAHAALVYEAGRCVGWCQYGSPQELPRIKHRRAYEQGLQALPRWRITCFFVDKDCRGRGVATAALAGALQQIARQGGGRVESYPEDVSGRKVSPGFLHNASLGIFEAQGFQRVRALGKRHWVVAREVEAAPA